MKNMKSGETRKELPLVHYTGNVWGALVPDEPKGFVENMSFGVDAGLGRWEPFYCYFIRRVANKKSRSVELRFFDRSDRPYLPNAKLCLLIDSPAR